MKNEVNILIEKIKDAESIVLIAHKNPDGDALGSVLALMHLIELNYDKEVSCVYDGNIPDALKYIPLRGRIKYVGHLENKDKKFDLAILLDYGTVNNIGETMPIIENAKFVAEIDHHKNDNKLGALCIDDDTASATAVLVYEIMRDVSLQYDDKVLDLIAIAILTDTGMFKYVHDGRALRIMSELVDAGVDINNLVEIMNNKPKKTIQTEARAVADAEFFYRNRLVVAVIDSRAYRDLDGRGTNALGLLGQIKGVEYSVLLKEQKPNQIGVSLRSKTKPVNRIAEKLGGGGHMYASGAVVKDSLENVKNNIIELFKGV